MYSPASDQYVQPMQHYFTIANDHEYSIYYDNQRAHSFGVHVLHLQSIMIYIISKWIICFFSFASRCATISFYNHVIRMYSANQCTFLISNEFYMYFLRLVPIRGGHSRFPVLKVLHHALERVVARMPFFIQPTLMLGLGEVVEE